MMKYNARQRLLELPKAIFFDIDNTLYAYEPAHRAASALVRKKAAALYTIDETAFDVVLTEARVQIKDQLGYTASSHSRLLYYQRALELLGLGAQMLTALDLEQTYWRAFLLNAKLFDGVIDTFNEVRLRGIPSVFVTDLTAQIQMRKIVHFGLDKYVDYLVTSEESGSDKVSPHSYELAIKKVGVAPGSVWMIGDNPETDIVSARSFVNAVTIQKLHKGVPQPKEILPDATFSQFRDLTALIAKLSNANGSAK